MPQTLSFCVARFVSLTFVLLLWLSRSLYLFLAFLFSSLVVGSNFLLLHFTLHCFCSHIVTFPPNFFATFQQAKYYAYYFILIIILPYATSFYTNSCQSVFSLCLWVSLCVSIWTGWLIIFHLSWSAFITLAFWGAKANCGFLGLPDNVKRLWWVCMLIIPLILLVSSSRPQNNSRILKNHLLQMHLQQSKHTVACFAYFALLSIQMHGVSD